MDLSAASAASAATTPTTAAAAAPTATPAATPGMAVMFGKIVEEIVGADKIRAAEHKHDQDQ